MHMASTNAVIDMSSSAKALLCGSMACAMIKEEDRKE
jgi:hypothetical protein